MVVLPPCKFHLCINEKSTPENFIFVNNDLINHTHLWKYGLHLNENGKVVLANNLMKYINNFLYQNRILTHNR